MTYSRLHNHLRKIFTLVAAALILPALAHAGTDYGQGNNGQNNGNQYGRNPIPTVPEANAGIVLIPFVGAILLFSARQLFRAKAAQKSGC